MVCFTSVSRSTWRIVVSEQFPLWVRREAWKSGGFPPPPPPQLQHRTQKVHTHLIPVRKRGHFMKILLQELLQVQKVISVA